ncbi:hypothetical protein ABIA95_002750 [Bradyrhizobium sp. LA8.1]
MKPLRHPPPAGPGHRLPMTLLHLRVRDLFLRAAAEIHCAGISNHAAAEWLHKRLARYRECGWQRDRIAETVPPRLAGRVEGLLFCVLKCSDRLVSSRLVRAVLARD